MSNQVTDLSPAPYNPRVISDEQMRMLRASMVEFGDLSGIVYNIRTGQIVGGHQRVKAFDPDWPITKEPHADTVGTVAVGYIETPDGRWSYREVDWHEQKEKAANIAANKHGGAFDNDVLSMLLRELRDGGYDMDLTGFDEDELLEMIGVDGAEGQGEGSGDEEEIIEPPEKPVAQRGDVWLLGDHRLMCGDSTSKEDIARLMDGSVADMIWTDPPYNVAYESKAGKIDNDDMSDEDFEKFLTEAFARMSESVKPGGVIYVAHSDTAGNAFRKTMMAGGFLLKQVLIWVKNAAVLSRQDYNWKHEPILYGWKEGAGHYFSEDFTLTTVIDDDVDVTKLDKKELVDIVQAIRNNEPTTVIRIDKPGRNDIHPTMKPVALVERMVINSCTDGQIVLDPFGGGGATLITCEKNNRVCRSMELDPRYATAIIERWQKYTGHDAYLQGPDGTLSTYRDIKAIRTA